jgi:hypothetical protein
MGSSMQKHVITVSCSGGAYLDDPNTTEGTYNVKKDSTFKLKINVPNKFYQLTSTDAYIDSNNYIVVDKVKSNMNIRVVASDNREEYTVKGSLANVEDIITWPTTVKFGDNINFEFKAVENNHISHYEVKIGNTTITPKNIVEIKEDEYIKQLRFSIEEVFGNVEFEVVAIPDDITPPTEPEKASILFHDLSNDTISGLSAKCYIQGVEKILNNESESVFNVSDEVILKISCSTRYIVNKSNLSIKDKNGNSIYYKFVRYDGTIVDSMTDQEILADYGKHGFRIVFKLDRDIDIYMKAEKEFVATYNPLTLEVTNSSSYDGYVKLNIGYFGGYPGFMTYHDQNAGGSETFVNLSFNDFKIDTNTGATDNYGYPYVYAYGKTITIIPDVTINGNGVPGVHSILPSFTLDTESGNKLTGTISISVLSPSDGNSASSNECTFGKRNIDNVERYTISMNKPVTLFSTHSQTIVKINITGIE